MKFRKFGKTVLTAALSSAIVFSLSSCVRSFTVAFLYVTGTITSTPSGNGIISGFKIDNNTGKPIPLHGLPISSGGANPVRAVLLSNGRFVYVLNRGVTAEGGSVCTTADPCTGGNITEFAVGFNGILTPQQTFFTQGINPFRLISDVSGNYLLALDHDAPSGAYCSSVVIGATTCGDITVFAVNSETGRLSLVTNAQLTSSTGNQVTYFPVPANPIDFTGTSNFFMTLSGLPGAPAGQTVYPYLYNSANGQLVTSSSPAQIIINGNGSPLGQGTAIIFSTAKIYILDNEPITVDGATSPSQILPFNVSGTNGALSALTGGPVANDPAESNPIYLITESKSKFVYVANQTGASSATGAGIAGFIVDPNSDRLSEDPGSPWGTGAGAQCLLEDPSDQYIYTANADSTISGRLLDPNSGALRQVSGWSGSYPLNGPATWCVATGRTD